MDLGLASMRILITGSTAGIGFAAARQFALERARVIVNGRTQDRVDAAVSRLRAEVPQAEVSGIAADVSTAAGCDEIVRQAPDVDVLVNNAGVFAPRAFEDISDGEWLAFFETNVMSGVRLARAYMRGMIERNWGRIVFVSSESGLQIPVEMIHYGTTKTAQLAVARGLAERTRGTGVTVNSVLPGPTASEGVSAFVRDLAAQQELTIAEMEASFFETARPTSLLGRFLSPDEVASMIVYVSSKAASGTTGASLRVDGGVIRTIA
ncbi:MAG: 3-oxoacyl-[acyl-carrier protein] reductase [Myxococcales bacterium]|nr:3-oxoacyl-[acyl-carrier protein] reductase [Myxococcales bacterium]